MFDILSGWWGGAISTIAGTLTIYAAVQIIQSRYLKIYYDLFTSSPAVPTLPKNVTYTYKHNEREFDLLFETNFIIKNKTGSALSDDDFITTPRVRIPVDSEVLECVIFRYDGNSFSTPEINGLEKLVILKNIVIPIDGCLSGYIISTAPLKYFSCVHKTKAFVKCDYQSIKYDIMTNFMISLSFFLFVFPTIFLSIPALSALANNIKIYVGVADHFQSSAVFIVSVVAAICFTVIRFKLFSLSPSEKRFKYLRN